MEAKKTVAQDHADQITKAGKAKAKMADLTKADQDRKAKSKADLAKALKEKKAADPVKAKQAEAVQAKAGMVKAELQVQAEKPAITILKADTALSKAMAKAKLAEPEVPDPVDPITAGRKAKAQAEKDQYHADRAEAKAARLADRDKRRAEKKAARAEKAEKKGKGTGSARMNGFDPPLRPDNRRKVSLLMPEEMFQAFLAQVTGDKSAFKAHVLALLDTHLVTDVSPAKA
jgi:hypothetical protein